MDFLQKLSSLMSDHTAVMKCFNERLNTVHKDHLQVQPSWFSIPLARVHECVSATSSGKSPRCHVRSSQTINVYTFIWSLESIHHDPSHMQLPNIVFKVSNNQNQEKQCAVISFNPSEQLAVYLFWWNVCVKREIASSMGSGQGGRSCCYAATDFHSLTQLPCL